MHAALRTKELLRPYYLRWLYFQLFPSARPAEFSECWRLSCYALTPSSLAAQFGRASKPPAFLFYPMTDFHARVQRTHHLASAIAAGEHLSFVLNPHLGREFHTIYVLDSAPRFGMLGPHFAELHARLPAEPVYHSRLLTARESERLADAISALAEVSGSQLAQIVSLPTWLDAALLLRRRLGWPIVYDCHDLIEGFQGISQDIIAAEHRLFQEADLVLFSSQHLLEHYSRRNPALEIKSLILRNATGAAHFEPVAAQRERRRASVGWSRIPKNGTLTGKIGYFGALDDWFDIELIRACAVRFPTLTFELIGRVEYGPIRALAELPNIEVRDEIPYQRLPEAITGFDAAIIPFRVTPLTLATNPIKLYEYLSCGLPVISTPLPEVEAFGDLVYIADNAKSFGDAILRALEEDSAAKHHERIEVARNETWNMRAAQLLDSASRLFSGPAAINPDSNLARAASPRRNQAS